MKAKNLWCIHTAEKATVVRKAKTMLFTVSREKPEGARLSKATK